MIKTILFLKYTFRTIVAALFIISLPMTGEASILSRQLDIGSSGTDVAVLQSFLAQDNTLYPQGLVTGYYGFLTKAAVSNFQNRNGINSDGKFNKETIIIMNHQRINGMNSGNQTYVNNGSASLVSE
jgi:peptidoglycan hydrolase-like protein with peptidoglycan-binding domain